jgi:carbamoyltransferase
MKNDLSAFTHLFYSDRVQNVSKSTNERFRININEFKKLTGYLLSIITSFNVRGEPIVYTPFNAFRCFMNTEIDFLVLNNYLFYKIELDPLKNQLSLNYKFELDKGL